MFFSWLALALLVVTASAAVGLWQWHKRRARTRRVARVLRKVASRGLNHPLVFAHGLFGFDQVSVAGMKHQYFRGLADRLRQHGIEAYTVRLSPSASIATRAEQLKQAIGLLPAEQVNILAHSMGGLDARYAISKLGLADKVASLTTIGTPHRGTHLANLGTSMLGERFGIRRLCQVLGIDVGAFYDLTTERLAAFNAEVPNVESVQYASIVGAPGSASLLTPLLVPSYLYLRRLSGANDGVVPADSQCWGECISRVEADHWAQIGWSTRFDAPKFYETVVEQLRERAL